MTPLLRDTESICTVSSTQGTHTHLSHKRRFTNPRSRTKEDLSLYGHIKMCYSGPCKTLS
jgi:hypothetical protein